MNTVLEKLRINGIVPVVVIESEAHALPLAKALTAGGLTTMEITFRTKAASNAMALISKGLPGMMMGAGTVLTVDQVKAAIDSGAQYIVSPGLNRKVVEHCVSHAIPVTPGVATPTEIEAALDLGLSTVKFFPAEANGGLDYLKAISAPYKNVRFIPTGGIDESNLLMYLKFPPVLACGGSWMVRADLIAGEEFDEIARLAASAVGTMLGFQLMHVGINNADAEEAGREAQALARLLRLGATEGSSSVFVGSQFEFLKRQYLGTHGHLAIGTHFIERAIAHLSGHGYAIREETKGEKDGRLSSVYLEKEIGGFAIHLLQI